MLKAVDLPKTKTLEDLFKHGIKDIYYAEKKIFKSLPKMIKAAHDDGLREALEDHRAETEQHIAKLEQIFSLLEMPPKAQKCDAIDGILEEAEGILKDFGKSKSCDAAIIFSGQAVEHYEIARYGTLRTWAEELGMEDAAALFQATLDEEYACDETLTAIATGEVNLAAEDGKSAPKVGKKSVAMKKT